MLLSASSFLKLMMILHGAFKLAGCKRFIASFAYRYKDHYFANTNTTAPHFTRSKMLPNIYSFDNFSVTLYLYIP
jgi:hypothetical protein